MANIYLNQFNEKLNTKTLKLPEALQTVLTQYVADSFSDANAQISADEKKLLTEKLKTEIENLIEHLKTATIGNWVQNHQFASKPPEDLKQLLLIAKLNEQSTFNAPSALVSDCENIAAGEAFSAHEIFRQIARLEKALKDNAVEERYKFEVQSKIVTWIALLYEKFALMMIESSSLEELNTTFDSVFDKAVCLDLPQLQDFQEHIAGQIDYLDTNGFFDDFYEAIKLSDKYEFVYEFYQAKKEYLKQHLPELRATMIHMFYQTINKAYAPCEVEKFNLMRNQGATIETVFGALQVWTKENWVVYQNTDFHVELQDRLGKEQETYKDWQEVGKRLGASAPKPMYQLHCMKYAGDPKQDPKDLLAMLPSPVKPKAAARTLSNTAPTVTSSTARVLLPNSHPLLCDEQLDEEQDEGPSQKRSSEVVYTTVSSEHKIKKSRV